MASPDVSQSNTGLSAPSMPWVRFQCALVQALERQKPADGRPDVAAAVLMLSYALSMISYFKASNHAVSFTRRQCETDLGLKRHRQESARAFLRGVKDALGIPVWTEEFIRDDSGGHIRYFVNPSVMASLVREVLPEGSTTDAQLEILFNDRSSSKPPRSAEHAQSPNHPITQSPNDELRRSLIAELRESGITDQRAKKIVGTYAPEHIRRRIDAYHTLPQHTERGEYFKTHRGSYSSQLVACIESEVEWAVPDSAVAKKAETNASAAVIAANADMIRKEDDDRAGATRNLMIWLSEQSQARQSELRDGALKSLPASTQKSFARGASHALGFYQSALERKIEQAMSQDRAPP